MKNIITFIIIILVIYFRLLYNKKKKAISEIKKLKKRIIKENGSLNNYLKKNLKLLNLTKKKWNLYKNTIGFLESDNRYNLSGGFNNQYDGKYQFGEMAKKDVALFLKIKFGNSEIERKIFRNDNVLQDLYLICFTVLNYKYLNKYNKFKKLNKLKKLEILIYAHLLGAKSAKKYLINNVIKKDGFNTSGLKYINKLRKNSNK